MDHKLRLAILDMNAGRPNQGMRCIRELVQRYSCEFEIEEFDVRTKHELPGLDFDVYVSSGGPGDPLEGDGIWDKAWYRLIDDLWKYNKRSARKKFVFFICHSFQMACHHFKLATVTKRNSTSFGIMPVHLCADAGRDPVFQHLPNPFYAVDSRDWQIVQPKTEIFNQHGATLLAMENIKTQSDFESAIMAVRFSDEFLGTQFHPEADAPGMRTHFAKEEIRRQVIDHFGEDRYADMIHHLHDPDKIELTHNTILPIFIENTLQHLQAYNEVPA